MMRWVVILTLLCPLALSAGTKGKITGSVKDSQTGEALIGVNVVLEGTVLGAATGPDGYYVILNIPPGQYTLTASAIGFVKKSVTNVTVSVDLTTTIDVQLASTVLEIGQEVVITAERPVVRKDLTSSESRVDAAQIKSLPVSEVSEVLSLQSGITVDRGGGIHIRGGRTSEVAYWVDGVSVSDGYDGGQAVQVDNNSVQELQVISGTFNAEYGQAMSGIVNIITKDGQRDIHGSLSTYTGDYWTGQNWRGNDRLYYLGSLAQSTRTSDEIYYNLGSYSPFDNYNLEGSLSGPLGPLKDVTFYASGRYFRSHGWLYGDHLLNPDGSLAITPELDTFIFDDEGNLVAFKMPDQPVAMNDRTRYSGQAKLTFQFTNSMKLSLGALGSRIDYRDYNHEYFFNPTGDVQKFDRGYDLSAIWTHTLSATSFYTLNTAFFRKGFREYLYENPLDDRYITDPVLTARPTNYAFRTVGTNNHQFNRSTETRVAKLDLTSQVSRMHELKAGVEGKLHRLYLEDYTLLPVQDSTGRYRAQIPLISSPSYEAYTEKPVEFSGYVQDKLEYDRMIVNVGIRFDYFNSRGRIPRDPNDPNIYNPAKPENRVDLDGDGITQDEEQADPAVVAARKATWYTDAQPQYSISPRLGISYPITDQGILHFSYGHFLQIPSFIHLYQKPEYKVYPTQAGVQGVYGNPDLKPQKTVMYEFGLQQQLSDYLGIDVTMFYRDTRDWVSTSVAIPINDVERPIASYVKYINRDYSNARGVTLTLNKRPGDLLSMNLAYTFQVAEGLNSNPDEEYSAQQSNREPPKILGPLEWDQTHTVNATLGLGEAGWGVFALGRYGSGLPYTPVINQAEARGEDAARINQRNSRRRPASLTIDLRAYKNFTLHPLTFSFFVKVFNLLDRRNESDVYGETGRATATVEQLGLQNLDQFQINPIADYLMRPEYYSEPREIQFGVEVTF